MTNLDFAQQLEECRRREAVTLAAKARLERDDPIACGITRQLKAARQKAYNQKAAFQADYIDTVADCLSKLIPDSGNVLDGRGTSAFT